MGKEIESKIISLSDAANMVNNGDYIALGGFAITRCVVGFVHELIRQGKKDLIVSEDIVGWDVDLLIGAGVVRKLIFSSGSLDAFGPVQRTMDAFMTKQVEWEEWSNLAIEFRYLAGALGLPHMPIKSMLGSDLLKFLPSEVFKETTCPFTGEKLILVRALVPDVGIVHVQRADPTGNAQIDGPRWDNIELTRASKRVIITTEEIVDRAFIEKQPELTAIPDYLVDAVVHLPFGAYPTNCYKYYDHDFHHFQHYVKKNQSKEGFKQYLEENILKVTSFTEYLDKWIDLDKLIKLKADPVLGY
jgi:acyl CoA:acetate/3-ketoacid CoA transferase alpha subunit